MERLLFISHRIPYPPDRGEKIRGWNLLRHMAKRYRVHYGCLIDDPGDWRHVEMLRSYCADFAAFPIDKRRQKLRALARMRPGRPLMLDYYDHPGLRAWAAAMLRDHEIDIAYIYSTAMAPYVLGHEGPRRILDMQDIDSEKWAEYARHASWPMRLIWAREARTLLAYERQAAMACERTLLVSGPECERFAELMPEAADRVEALEQGVDLDFFSPGHELARPFADAVPRLVMVGNMDYWPNADGAVFFAREVMPRLRRRVVMPRFCVVGANPAPQVKALAAQGVEVTGRVADVRPYVLHAAVAVAPLRVARGIQNKVLEAMAMARPVVASAQAFEGVRAEAGRDALVGGDAAALARLVDAVLDGAHAGLGVAGRKAVETGYSWAATLRRLDDLLRPPEPNGNDAAGPVSYRTAPRQGENVA